MNVKQAYEILKRQFPNWEFYRCIEFDTVFVFSNDNPNSEPKMAQMDALWSVNKETGEIRNFKPFDIPSDEYKNGKIVENYK